MSESTVADADFYTSGTTFNGGSLTVTLDGYVTGDVLSVTSSAVAVGAVQLSSGSVQYSSNGSSWITIGIGKIVFGGTAVLSTDCPGAVK